MAGSKAAVGSETTEIIGLYAVTTIDSGELAPVDLRAATASEMDAAITSLLA